MNEQITRLHPVEIGAMSKRLSDAQERTPRQMRYVGELFAETELRLFDEARARFDLAISAARAAMEDANLDTQILDDHIADTIGDTWEAKA